MENKTAFSMRSLIIMDTTLRDGCQAPGFILAPHEKLAFAAQLEKLGVDIIESGFPQASASEFFAAEMISDKIRKPSISVMARCNEKDVKTAARSIKNAGSKIIHLTLATSPVHREYKLKKSKPEILRIAAQCVETALAYSDFVEIGAEDATRTETDFLLEFYNTVIQAGAAIINVPDTVGCIMPAEYNNLVKTILNEVVIPSGKDIRISVHCHNDLGLAVANTLAGISAGATQAELTVNGIGERAGNAALEETVMAIKNRKDFFGEISTKIITEEIYPTSRLLSRLTGMPASPNKPVVGANSFSHCSGIHQHGIINNPKCYSVIRPESVGRNENRIVLNRLSGREGLKETVSGLTGLVVTDKMLSKMFPDFKKFADGKKTVGDTELLDWLSKKAIFQQAIRYYRLKGFKRPGGGGRVNIRVEKNPGKKIISVAGRGSSFEHSVFNAFRKIVRGRLYLIQACTSGCFDDRYSFSRAYVTLKYNEKEYYGEFCHKNPDTAIIESFLGAINRILQRRFV